MRPYDNNSPFGSHFGGPFAGMGKPPFGCPFRGGVSPDHHIHKPSFGLFGWRRFDLSPERHCHREAEHPRCRRGPSECNCCSPHSRGRRHERGCHSPGTNRPHPWFGRNADHHCCGRRGQSESSECCCRRKCEGSRGNYHYKSDCCLHAPCCDQRRKCHDNHCEGQTRSTHCENCCEYKSCCCGNKEGCACERDESLVRTDDERARENKIRMVVLWLLKELFWKTFKGQHRYDDNNNM